MKRLLSRIGIRPKYAIYYKYRVSAPWLIDSKAQYFSLKKAKLRWSELMFSGQLGGSRISSVAIKNLKTGRIFDERQREWWV